MTPTTLGIVFIGIGALFAIVAPRILAKPSFVSDHPRGTMIAWIGTLLAGGAVTLSGLMFIVGGALAHHVDHVIGHNTATAVYETVMGWLAVAALGIVAFRLGAVASDVRTEREDTRREILTLITSGQEIWICDRRAVRIPWDRAFAVASPRHRTVVFTSALQDAMSPNELCATITHEWAHLRNHHALILALGHLATSAIPFVPANRRLEQVMRIATELDADDVAAAMCGIEATAAALNIAYQHEIGVVERVTRLRARITNK